MHHGIRRIAGIELGSLVAPLERHGEQRAVGAVGPAVVAAAEMPDVALAVADHLGAAMAAAVVEDMHGAVAVPAHDDGLPAERRRDVVAGLRHLAVVADIDPGPPEDPRHLELEQLGIDIDVAVNAFRFDQLADRRAVVRHCYLSNLPRPWHPLSVSLGSKEF